MRIAVFCGDRGIPARGPSGASAHLRAIARALTRAGHDVVLATPRAEDHRGAVAEIDVEVVHAEPRRHRWLGPWRERGELWDARRLADALSGPIDLVWERHALFCDAGMRLAASRGVPRIVELNAPLSIERPNVRDRVLARRIERETLVSADRVIAVSSWLETWAGELGCADVRRVPNGTDVGPGDADRGRDRVGVDGPVAVWVGSCKGWHGLQRLPDLAEALPDWTIAVVGSGPVAVPEHPRIRALGRLEGAALDDVLAASSVGLCTNDPEVMPWVCPLKILDYRAAGLPVVSTAAGDSRTLVDRGAALESWSAREAAEAVQTWAARDRISRVRSWDQVASEALAGLG